MEPDPPKPRKILEQLRIACRRPLFEDVVLTHAHLKRRRKQNQQDSAKNADGQAPKWDELSWSELLSKAAAIIHLFTNDEHKELLHLCTILYLGFLLPHSTGNEHHLLRNIRRNENDLAQPFDPVKCVLEMPLTDRLSQLSTTIQQSHYQNEFECLTDPKLEIAYHEFLESGLRPILEKRPIHREQVDMLHLIAMVINPQPPLPKDTTKTSEKTRELMRHVVAPKFSVHAGHRFQWVQLLAQQVVVLPPLSSEYQHEVSSPLVLGAIPHLQASLISYAQSAVRLEDATAAYAALAATVGQAAPFRSPTWELILENIIDNPAPPVDSQDEVLLQGPMTHFWPLICHSHYICYGQILSAMLLNGGRRLAPTALSSLSDAIEWQVDAWTTDEEEPDKKPPVSPDLLTALLCASRHALFVMPPKKLDEEVLEALAESSLQLLNHPDSTVRSQALEVLKGSIEFKSATDVCAKGLLGIIVNCENPRVLDGLDQVVRVVVQSSAAFANQLSKHLCSKVGKDLSEVESKLLATVWSNNPAAISEEESVYKTIEGSPSPVALHLGAALLARRQTYYFPSAETEEVSQRLQRVLATKGDRWDQYRLGCHAMTVGDFLFATLIFDDLVNGSLNEDHFLWVSALKNIAMAEGLLGSLGSDAIPDASGLLHTALSYIHHLDTVNTNATKRGFAFQSRLLFLRLDQLDLITVIRQLTRETRLTGEIPPKTTRSHQHLVNAVRGLGSLGLRYQDLNQKYGIHFQSNLSSSCLLAQQDVCNFLSNSTKTFFPETFPPSKSTGTNDHEPRKTFKFLASKLMEELDTHFIKALDEKPMEPLVRAAAMLELLEGLLKAPNTFPRDFFSPRPTLLSNLKLTAVPSENADYGQESCDIIEACPSICFYCAVNGKVPTELIQKMKHPIVAVFLWCNLVYSSSLEDDDAKEGATTEEIKARLPDVEGPHRLNMCADGRFHGELEMPHLADEGNFCLETKLGCQDSSGAQWELQVELSSSRIMIRSSRSR